MFRILHHSPRRPMRWLAAAGLAFVLSACGGGGGVSDGTGTLQMSLTDAPACGYDHVYVTISQLSVHQSGSASDGDAGWVEIPVTPQRIDLLSLQNGVMTTLGTTPLAAGKYTQMRLLLADNASASAGQPIPNAVVPTGGSETALKTPSGQQTGLKMNVDIDIAADKLADFVIDFNACKSVVRAGGSGNILLKPVLAVTPVFVTGVQGTVDASIANGDTTVALETQAGEVVKATTPDGTTTKFLLPVAPGTYNLVVTSRNHATAVVTSVVVSADSVTTIGSTIAPPTSTTGTIGGTVVAPAPIDVSLAATQLLAGGSTIEVASTSADATLGTYSFTLPVAAPMVAPYTTGTLTFTADGGAAGKYSVAATLGATTKTSSLLTVTAGGNVAAGFTFP
jgi:hypothetical protein